jgi:hypothetical protein
LEPENDSIYVHVNSLASFSKIMPASFDYGSKLVDSDANRDGTIFGLQDDQVVVVGDILYGGIDETGPGKNVESHESSHDIYFAVGKTVNHISIVTHMLISGSCDLLLSNTRAAALAESNELLRQLVVWLSIQKPPLGKEVIGVREKFRVPMVDHRCHADGRSPWDNPLGLAILALVNKVFLAGDSGRSVGNTGHHAEALLDYGPEVGSLLELHPLQVLGVETLKVLHEARVDLRLCESPVREDGESSLVKWSEYGQCHP